MPDISLPEIHLPDVKLPDGLRDMNRKDIQQALGDVKPPRIELPKRIDFPDIDLSDVDLPKAIEDRLPNRRRPNPLLPIAGLAVVGAMIAGAWWLISTPDAGRRVRERVEGAWLRLTGRSTDLVRYDDEADLGSLLALQGDERPASTANGDATWPGSTDDPAATPVRVDGQPEATPAH